MNKLIHILLPLLILLGLVSCYDPHAQGSKIVREVEAAGAGDLSTFTQQGLSFWFRNHAELAVKIDRECTPLYPNATANWITSAEGTVCLTAHSNQPLPKLTADPRAW